MWCLKKTKISPDNSYNLMLPNLSEIYHTNNRFVIIRLRPENLKHMILVMCLIEYNECSLLAIKGPCFSFIRGYSLGNVSCSKEILNL